MRKIVAITGIRSEYDILYPVIKELKSHNSLSVSLIVCNSHLSEFHGNTYNSIKKDGFKIVDKIDCLFSTDRNTQRVKGIGILTYALSQSIEREKPDLLLVVGDREESIATAIVGNYMGVPVAHIGGGDPVYGNADDPIRMAVSKLSHIHFTTSEEYAKNLLKIGESGFRIFNTGNPALWNILNTPKKNISYLNKKLKTKLIKNKYFIFIKHPLSSELEDIDTQIEIALKSANEFCEENNFKLVGITPNTDPGSEKILRIFEKYKNHKNLFFFKTLEREIFINLLRNSSFIAGNSSMGILEAPFYKLPVVNIGSRQKGRINAGNVEFVNYEQKKIIKAMNNAAFNKKYRKSLTSKKFFYGNGKAPQKISSILNKINIKDVKWLLKNNLVG